MTVAGFFRMSVEVDGDDVIKVHGGPPQVVRRQDTPVVLL
jgi:hypothetical protein